MDNEHVIIRRLNGLRDILLEIISLHEINKIFVYSDTISSQLGASYAAHAFTQMQQSLHSYEILKLAKLWDPAADDRVGIPSLNKMVFASDAYDLDWKNKMNGWVLSVQQNPKFQSIKEYRANNIAHKLDLKPKAHPLKYGDENLLLDESIEIFSEFYAVLNDTEFAWDRFQAFARMNAEAFLHGCKIEVLR